MTPTSVWLSYKRLRKLGDKKMIKSCDCLFVAYSGLNLKASQKVLDENNVNVRLEPAFNAATVYLSSYLNKRHHTFEYINSFEEEKELLIDKLKNNISLVAISTTFVEDVSNIIDMVKFIRQYNKNCKIVVGGTFIAYTINQYSDYERDIIFRRIKSDFIIYSYFGENALVQLIDALKNDKSYSHIGNLYYRENHKYIYTFKEDDKTQLKDNMVDWSLFKDKLGIYVSVRTAISCPYRCSYCSFPKYGGKYQTININAIEQELKQLTQIRKTGIVHFVDDCFNKPGVRFKDILRMLIRNQFPFKWHSFLRCDDVDDETIELMKESGCLGTLIGLESGCPDMLKRMNKDINLDRAKIIINKLRNAGIITYALFIVGFPGETIDSVKRTIKFIEECRPDFYALSPWYCNINAPIYSEKERYNIQGKNYEWSHSTMDFVMARDLALEMFYSIKNSYMLTINYTFLFQLLYNNIKGSKLIEIVKKSNQKLIVENNFESRKKNYLNAEEIN
jgi:radical SAM PhpK family P-methyltransferase